MKHFQNKIHRPAGFLGASDRWRNRPSRPRRQHDKPCRWEVVIGEASSWWLGEASSISDLSSDLSYDSRRLKKLKKVELVLMIEIDWILYFFSWLVPFFQSGIQLLLAKSVWKWWTPVPRASSSTHPQVAEKCKQVEEASTWGCMLCHRGGLRAIKPCGYDTEADGTLFGFASQGSCDMFFCRIRVMMNIILNPYQMASLCQDTKKMIAQLGLQKAFFFPKTLRPLNAMIHSTLNQSQAVYASITGASLLQNF